MAKEDSAAGCGMIPERLQRWHREDNRKLVVEAPDPAQQHAS